MRAAEPAAQAPTASTTLQVPSSAASVTPAGQESASHQRQTVPMVDPRMYWDLTHDTGCLLRRLSDCADALIRNPFVLSIRVHGSRAVHSPPSTEMTSSTLSAATVRASASAVAVAVYADVHSSAVPAAYGTWQLLITFLRPAIACR